MLWGRGDIPETMRGKRFLEEAVGREDLDAVSPTALASRIKVPVFLAAGGQDVRAPQEQTEAMERALRAAQVPVETLYYRTEGHGFYKPEHQLEYYGKLLAFFRKNLRYGVGEATELLSDPAK
jgi:dipeptidyl aminopeptidase/acylaminoacyl peptidase